MKRIMRIVGKTFFGLGVAGLASCSGEQFEGFFFYACAASIAFGAALDVLFARNLPDPEAEAMSEIVELLDEHEASTGYDHELPIGMWRILINYKLTRGYREEKS